MKDREFLKWIHTRLELFNGDDPESDHMHKLMCIIYATPPDRETPIVGCDVFDKLENIDIKRPSYKSKLSQGEF